MNFSKHRCLGQAWLRFPETAEKTASRSLLCQGFVVSRSVMPAELSADSRVKRKKTYLYITFLMTLVLVKALGCTVIYWSVNHNHASRIDWC